MRLTLAASDLHDALKQSALARSTPMPVLQHARLATVDDHHVAIEATDLVAYTRIVVPANVLEPGAELLDGAKLLAIAGGGGELAIATHGKVTRGRSRYTLPFLPPQDFPAPDDAAFEPLDLDAAALGAAIAQVEHACSTGEARPYLRGIGVRERYVFASDGAVLSVVRMATASPLTLLLPPECLRHLQGLLNDTATLAVANAHDGRAGKLRVESGNTTVVLQLMDYPPLDIGAFLQGLKRAEKRITLQRKPLTAAVRGFSPFVVTYNKADSGVILVRRDGQLRVADNAGDAPNQEDVTALVVDTDTGDFAVGLSHRYLQGVLGAIGSDDVDWYPQTTGPNVFLPRDGNGEDVLHAISPQAVRG